MCPQQYDEEACNKLYSVKMDYQQAHRMGPERQNVQASVIIHHMKSNA